MRNAGLEEAQLKSRLWEAQISHEITLLAESEEELKSLLMK